MRRGERSYETELGRDVFVVCWDNAPCTVFRYHGRFSLLPAEMLRLDGPSLVPVDSWSLYALGSVLPPRRYWPGYLAGTSFFLVPSSVVRLVQRKWARREALALVGAFAAIFLVLLLHVVVELSRLSLPLILVLWGAYGCVRALLMARA